jgi:hypothetical protein
MKKQGDGKRSPRPHPLAGKPADQALALWRAFKQRAQMWIRRVTPFKVTRFF